MQGIEEHRQRAFSLWLRTGRRVRDPDNREIERKFNPWHDPRDGRFTFAESGVRSGAGGAGTARPARSRVPKNQPKVQYVQDFGMAPLASMAEVEAWRARELAKYRGKPGYAEAIEAQYRLYQQAFAPRPDSTLNNAASAAVDLARGVGAGVVDTGKDTAASVRTAVTTNPVTTVQNVERGIAGTIDEVISAEDVSATEQISQAVDAVTHASAYDVGYAIGAAGSAVGVALGSMRVAAKIARAGRRGRAIERGVATESAGPKVKWVDENNGLKRSRAKDYNDSATGARSNVQTRRGQAPALERTMPDGTIRLVRFDGVDGGRMTERKLRIVRSPKARDQALRQADVLKQHGLTGIWEVPTEAERRQAIKLLNNLGISNIQVRVIKPW